MLLIPATTEAWAPERGEGTTPPTGEDDVPDAPIDDDNDGGPEGNIPEQGSQLPEIYDPDPQSLAMRSTASAGASDVTGSYLAVKCQIYNVAGGEYAATDVCLYDGWAVIPAAFSWVQGNKYIYTFVFGEGDFGYNGGNGDTPTPDEEKVLTSMNYTVTVDNFIEPDDETFMNMTR